jgi:hypothetical protein
MRITGDFLNGLEKRGVSTTALATSPKKKKKNNKTSKAPVRRPKGGDKLTQDFIAGIEGRKEDVAPIMDTSGRFTVRDDDIAPVSTYLTGGSNISSSPYAASAQKVSVTGKKKDKDGRKWFQKGAFEDGYDPGDISKTILGTLADVGENLVSGVVGMGETAIDALAQIAPYAYQAQVTQNGGIMSPKQQKMHDEIMADAKKDIGAFVAKDLYDEEKVAKQILSNIYGAANTAQITMNGGQLTQADIDRQRKNTAIAQKYLDNQMEAESVLGEKSDALVSSAGQLAAQYGLTMVGVPWYLTAGATSFGGEAENAYRNGATFDEATGSAAISAGAEILSEKLFGGDVFVDGAASDMATKYLATAISNKALRKLAKVGMEAGGEALEEGASQFLSNLGTSLYREENLGEILFSEEAIDEYIESMIGGGVLGGGMTTVNAVQSSQAGVDIATGLTENEQKVVEKVYQDRLAEMEENGKVSAKEKAKLYETVTKDMEKGYISTDTIEDVLGDSEYDSLVQESEEFKTLYETESGKLSERQKDRLVELKAKNAEKSYESALREARQKRSDSVFSLVQSDRLAESYNEKTRRGQAFEADLTGYTPEQRKVVENAVRSGLLNNTNRSHELVDFVAKISADKGINFDFTNNAKIRETGFGIEGKIVNGYKTDSGITLNVDSPKYLQSTVGHEITHVLEGTEFYDSLQKTIFDYAKSKGEFDSRFAELSKLYEGMDADVNAELTADLVGDYLFQDSDFVRKLSTENRNVFRKIYDEIKYLCKKATAGSKEARELEKVKKAFMDAYRGVAKTETPGSVETQDYSSDEFAEYDPDSFNDSPREMEELTDEEFEQIMAEAEKVTGGEPKYSLAEIKPDIDALSPEDRKVVNDARMRASYARSIASMSDSRISRAYSDYSYPNAKTTKGYFAYIDPLDFLSLTTSNVDKFLRDNPNKLNEGVSEDWGTENKIEESGILFLKIDEDGNVIGHEGRHRMAALYRAGVERVALIVETPRVDDAKPISIRKLHGQDFGHSKSYGSAYLHHMLPISKEYERINRYTFGSVADKNRLADPSLRYSLSDSSGKELSKEQREYFKDSKMRDDDGNLMVMYHGSQDAGFHTFDANMSDDGTSFFFVDRNDVAASYSGTTETYEARSIRNADDMNNFIAEIGAEGYEVIEKDGKFILLYEGDRVADSNTAKGIYDEFCWYEGVGNGDANYKVYLNLKKPLVVDAKGRPWNKIDAEFSQEVYDRFQSLTPEEKEALTDLAEWEDFRIFNSEIQEATEGALASAYQKMGEDMNIYDLFSAAADSFSEDSMRENSRKYLKTRDYAARAKERGFDGVIFKNIIDNGGYSNGSEGASTVAIAFDSNQIKSVANDKPTADPDIRYSLSEKGEAPRRYGDFATLGKDVALAPETEVISEMETTTEESPAVPEAIAPDMETTGSWRDILETLGEPDGETDDWSDDYYFHHKDIESAVLNASVAEVIRDAENGMSRAELAQKSRAAIQEYQQVQANKPYGEAYTEKENLMLRILHNQYSMYDSIARNPAYVSELKKALEPVSETDMFPDEPTPQKELDTLYQEQAELESQMLEMGEDVDEDEAIKISNRYMEVLTRAAELETELAEADAERVNSLDDADAPPEMDAPYYSENPAAPDDPFYERDIVDVGNRKVKAYMYENPEVKPFFQDAANVMLGDLHRGVRGEKIFNDEVYYQSGGEKGWMGTKRQTTDDIAELLDQWHYTYAEIEKGLKAIIEDSGKENNAVSKRIEFMLNERLMNGYTDVFGEPIPPNQDYINLLNEMQINESAREAFDSFMETADQYAPEDIGPTIESTFDAPTYDTDGGQQSLFEPEEPYTFSDTPNGPYRQAKYSEIYGQMTYFNNPKPDQRVAQVLSKPTKRSQPGGILQKAAAAVVDKGIVFENYSYQTGNHEIQAKWNSTLPGKIQAKAQSFMRRGAEGVRPYNDIVKEVLKSGNKTDFETYLNHALNVDRMTLGERYGMQDKTVFGETITADVSRQKVAEYEAAHPEYKQWANEIYANLAHMRKMMVDAGLISQETSDKLAEMYPHYVPIARSFYQGQNVSVPLDTNKTGVNNPLKRAEGGSSDIEPTLNTIAKYFESVYRAIARNSFGVELKNQMGTVIEQPDIEPTGDPLDLDAQEETLLKPGTKTTNPTFTVFENGERVEFEVTEDMYEALKPRNKLLAYRNETIGKIGSFRRNLLTVWNTKFSMWRNPIKDSKEVLINSQHPLKTYANMYIPYKDNAAIQILFDGEWAQEYDRNGGESNSYYDSKKNKFDQKGIIRRYVGAPVRGIEAVGGFLEKLPRLAEYIASRKEGRSIDQAMLDASRVTTNFDAGGDITKFADAHGATFLNASVQGASQHVRNFRESYHKEGILGVTKTIGKYVLSGLPVLIYNHLRWDDDEDYAELNDYVKENYVIVWKTKDGKFIRIPKGRTEAVMSEALQQMKNLVTGDDEADLATLNELFWSNIAPNNVRENNIIAPIQQALDNKAWYGDEIIPSRLHDLPSEEQYDESTDALSRWLGENFDPLELGPYRINYLLDQYSGALGDTFLPMMTPEAESGDDTLAGNIIAPWKKELTTDSVLNNKHPGEFYNLRDELEVKSNSKDATQEDQMRTMYMDSVSWEMSDLYAQKREIQSSDLPDSEKYEAVRELQEQINEMAKNALNVYNRVSINGLYSEVGDKRYNQDAESGKWYEIREKNSDGSDNYYYQKEQEVTKGLGIAPGEYWNNREEYNYAYDNPEKYTVSKAVGGYKAFRSYTSDLWDIKADKDKNGKSINGSRKEKVIDYLNNLDADYGEKIILFKSEYPADDTYNMDIIDYLNSRDDIDFDETVTILKYLGFEVDSKGNITWD